MDRAGLDLLYYSSCFFTSKAAICHIRVVYRQHDAMRNTTFFFISSEFHYVTCGMTSYTSAEFQLTGFLGTLLVPDRKTPDSFWSFWWMRYSRHYEHYQGYWLSGKNSWFKYNISFCIIQMFWRKSWLRQFVLALHIFKDINYSNVQLNYVIIVMYIICMEHILSLFSRPKWNHFNAFNCTFYHLLTVVSCVRPFKYAPLHVCLWLSNLCTSHPPPLVWGAGCNSPWDSVAPITRAV